MLKVHDIIELPLENNEHLQVVIYTNGQRDITHMTRDPLHIQKFRLSGRDWINFKQAIWGK